MHLGNLPQCAANRQHIVARDHHRLAFDFERVHRRSVIAYVHNVRVCCSHTQVVRKKQKPLASNSFTPSGHARSSNGSVACSRTSRKPNRVTAAATNGATLRNPSQTNGDPARPGQVVVEQPHRPACGSIQRRTAAMRGPGPAPRAGRISAPRRRRQWSRGTAGAGGQCPPGTETPRRSGRTRTMRGPRGHDERRGQYRGYRGRQAQECGPPPRHRDLAATGSTAGRRGGCDPVVPGIQTRPHRRDRSAAVVGRPRSSSLADRPAAAAPAKPTRRSLAALPSAGFTDSGPGDGRVWRRAARAAGPSSRRAAARAARVPDRTNGRFRRDRDG